MRTLDIGELARRVRLRPSALRYYEEIGLLASSGRSAGRRVFPLSAVRRIALIKMAQRAGFTLAEIRGLLDRTDQPAATKQWRALAERKLPELDRLIADMQTLRGAVADCLQCGCMDFESCQLLSAEGS